MDEQDWLDSEEFYSAMQGYRHAPIEDPKEVYAHFENVKRLIREHALYIHLSTLKHI